MKPTILSIASFAAGALATAALLSTTGLGAGGKDIDKAIEAYIVKHPDVIIDAVNNWQQGQGQRQAEAAKDVIKKEKDAIFNDMSDATAGNAKGDIAIVEFFDYNCGACKMMFQGLDKALENDKNIRVVFKEMPIFGEESNRNSAIGLAVAKLAPEKYYDFHKKMMTHEGPIKHEDALEYAVSLGLNSDKVAKEAESEWVLKKLADNHALAGKLSIQGTPALVMGETLIPSALSYEGLADAIKKERAE